MSVCYFEDDPAYSLEHIKQEYATCGTGDMHLPALDACTPDGSRLLDLHYQGHAVTPGKPTLNGLPATYTEQDDEAETPVCRLADPLAGVTVTLFTPSLANIPPSPAMPRSVTPARAPCGWTGP